MYAEKLKKHWKDGKSCSLRICCLSPTRKSYLFSINLLFAICKILGGKQGVLWEVCKWRIDDACLVKMAG